MDAQSSASEQTTPASEVVPAVQPNEPPYPSQLRAWCTVAVLMGIYGVARAGIQQMMPNSLRGQASAIFIFANALMGLGLAPLAIRVATDDLFRDEMKLHHSIVLVGLVAHVGITARLQPPLLAYSSVLEATF